MPGLPSKEQTTKLSSALVFFFLAALLGLSLRVAFVVEMPEWFKYKNIQHAHSHLAIMGWLTASFYFFICRYFQFNRPIYRFLFWASQATVSGMLLSFPIQGYAFYSILFSSIFMLLSYGFIVAVLQDIRSRQDLQGTIAVLFLKSSLFFLALSTVGIWAMGPIMASGLRTTAWYYGAVQFFLHFQFNGWFVFALLALMFKLFKDHDISISLKTNKKFHLFLTISCFLTYALSVTWSTPDKLLFWTNSIGVLLQAVALFYFWQIIKLAAPNARKNFQSWHFRLWGIAFFCLGFKIFIQTLVAIPALAVISYTIRNFVIGFIHLLMLGAFSTFLFGLMHVAKFRINSSGILLFLLGFLLTEILLFGQGLLIWMGFSFIPYYYILLALFSSLLPLSLLLIAWSVLYAKNTDKV
jgi:hypothetical protein